MRISDWSSDLCSSDLDAGDIAAHPYPMRIGEMDDRHRAIERFRDRTVDVALAEAFGCRKEDRDLVTARCDGSFHPRHIRHQNGITDSGHASDPGYPPSALRPLGYACRRTATPPLHHP